MFIKIVRIRQTYAQLVGLLFLIFSLSYASSTFSKDQACVTGRTGEVIYVDHNVDGGDGSSWGNAYQNIQLALDNASLDPNPNQIWVAKGRYPIVSNGLSITSGVQLYGGFSGSEIEFNQRSIEGNKTVLDGGGFVRHIFFVNDATDVVIDGLTITKGSATGDINADSLDILNEVRGAGILSINSELNVCNSIFHDNHAKKFGGAIFQQGGVLNILDSSFEKNSVLRGENEIHDTDMEADSDGGAIAVFNNQLLSVVGSSFRYNIAGDDAGAIASRKTNVEIIRSTFVKNKGISTALPPTTGLVDELLTGMGGAVQVWNDYSGFMSGNQSFRTEIKDSIFRQNESAIASALYIQSPPGSVTIAKGNTFSRNGGNGDVNYNSPINQQGVKFGRGVGTFLMVGLRLGDREQDSFGNFVRELHHAYISDSHFQENQGGYGGALGFIGMYGDISDVLFERNIARQRGGAIWNHNFLGLFDQFGGFEPDYGLLNIADSIFYENKALGELETLQHDTFPGFVSIEEQTYGGGAIHNEVGTELHVSNSLFIRNKANGSDGGAINNVSASVEFFGFASPSAVSYGASLSVEGSLFYKNTSSGSGGAISNGASQINGGVFNSGNEDLRSVTNPSQLSIKDSIFRSNAARFSGGAVANWNTSNADISSSTYIKNIASYGGAVSSLGTLSGTASLNIQQSKFLKNKAEPGTGGGIFSENSVVDIDSGSSFVGNSPQNLDLN